MNAPRILTTSCLLLLQTISQSAEWEKLPPLPAPNGGFVVAVDHDQIVIAGGTNWEGGKKNWLTEVWALDPRTLTWTARNGLKSPVAYAVAGTRDGRMVFAGGSGDQGGLRTVQQWSQDGFQAHEAELPPSAVLAAGGVLQHSLIFAGGTPDAAQIAQASTATWSIDLDTRKITNHSPYPGPPFLTAASAVDTRGTLFVFGGGTWDAKTQAVRNLDAAHSFDIRKNAWKKLRTLPYAARGMSAAMLDQDKSEGDTSASSLIYLGGGYKNDAEGFSAEAFIYDIAKDEYRAAPPLPYKAMVALVVLDGYLYCLGGEDKKQSRTDACYRIRVGELLK